MDAIKCENCGHQNVLNDENQGKVVRCQCGQRIFIPVKKEVAEPVQQDRDDFAAPIASDKTPAVTDDLGGLEDLQYQEPPRRTAPSPTLSQASSGSGAADVPDCLRSLAEAKGLVVKQNVEKFEAITGIETLNSYVVFNQSKQRLFFAEEAEYSALATLTRIFLKSQRPFIIEITGGLNSQILFELKRPFRLFFSRLDVVGPDRKLWGSIERRFAFLTRKYSVYNANGVEMLEIVGPLLHPWTFNVMRFGKQIAQITKKWSGLLKEAFTTADNFGLQFTSDEPVEIKALLLAALILIDFVHFERKN